MEPKTILLLETIAGQLEAFLSIEMALCGAVAAVAYHWLMKRPTPAVLLLLIPAALVGISLYKTMARYEEMQRTIGNATGAPAFIRDHINDFFFGKQVMLASGILLLIAVTAVVQICTNREKSE